MAKSAARLRGLWPESQSGNMKPSTTITIGLPGNLYAKLQKVVGGDPFTYNVEEAVVTCMRVLTGGLPISSLVRVVAQTRGVTMTEAFLGRPADKETDAEVRRLLKAAALVAEVSKLDPKRAEITIENERDILSKAWQSVAPGRDVSAEVEVHFSDRGEEYNLSDLLDRYAWLMAESMPQDKTIVGTLKREDDEPQPL